MQYRLKFEPDTNGTILVTSPDFPLVTYGATKEEAAGNARDAACVLLQSMIDNRDEIPPPAALPGEGQILRIDLLWSMKLRLYMTMRAAGLTRADLQRKLKWNRESVDRLFRLEHNSKIEQLDMAFAALGKGLAISVEDRERHGEMIAA